MNNTLELPVKDGCVGCGSKDNIHVIFAGDNKKGVGWCTHGGTVYWHSDKFYAKIPYNAPNSTEKPPADKMEA